MIHYFNPGHETAVLNASKHYQPSKQIVKMQEDLALLPKWYAEPADYIFTGQKVEAEKLKYGSVGFWGVSPQGIHYFETLNRQYDLQLQIPRWKEEYRFLGSRFAAQKALVALMEAIPDIDKSILPQFYSDPEEIENVVTTGPDVPERKETRSRWLLKSPYSSSGRGLLWLNLGKPTQSERQIIDGMLKKQSQISLEKALDKRLDFSMHFEITQGKKICFTGYSIFQTNAKGAYENSLLANQKTMEKQITNLIDKYLLQEVQKTLTGILQEMYAPYYIGNLGVDMLVYASENQFRLHPCIEINMRKSMGYLAIRLFENHINPSSQGQFFVEYHKSPQMLNEKHTVFQKQYPLRIENNRIYSGYLNLCPVTETTNYSAYILIGCD
jgi:hypothetical protein